MDLFNQTNSSKDDDDTNLNDNDFNNFYDEKIIKELTSTAMIEEQAPPGQISSEPFSNLNTNTISNKDYSKLILNETKPFSYYLKLYNKKQMLELDNPTFLSNQYKKQFKIASKLNNALVNSKNGEKYKTSNESVHSSSKKSDDQNELLKDFIRFKKKNEREDTKLNSYTNLTKKLVQEHKKIFSYNSYQNPNTLKHFIVHTTDETEQISRANPTANLDTDIEIDIIADIKNNSSDHTDQTDDYSLINDMRFDPSNETASTKSTSSNKPMHKLIKNLKQRFHFKKNIVDIKLPSSIAEDSSDSPMPLAQPNNSRQSIRSANSAKPIITIESKKVVLHQQPYLLVDKATSTSPDMTKTNPQVNNNPPMETPYRLPPPQNREMLSRIYNACNRKMKKPKHKVKIANESNLEIVNEKNTNQEVKQNRLRRYSKRHDLKRSKLNDQFKIESVSSFSSVNYSVLNEPLRQSYKLKANNIQLNPVIKLDPAIVNDPIKESIRNYRIRLDNINQNLNNLTLGNLNQNITNNNNNFCVTEFINEITSKNVSEPEVKTEYNKIKREKIKYSSQFNSSSTKSISVIDLSDLNEQDGTKRGLYNAFRPMKLNEYIKNTNQKNKTLASFIIDNNNNQNTTNISTTVNTINNTKMKTNSIVAKRAMEAATNKLIQQHQLQQQQPPHHQKPILTDTSYIKTQINPANLIKTNSNPVLNADPSDLFRREFSITNESSNNSLMIVSKKRVSFHEQVLETDVVSGNSTFKPIINYKYKNY